MTASAEQLALRRVAELIAHHGSPEQLFALVSEGLSGVLGVGMVRTLRFEPDGTATLLAARGRTADRIPPGTTITLSQRGVLRRVFETGLPAWIGDIRQVDGAVGHRLREEGVSVGAAGPILIDGRVWGAMLVGGESAEALPPGSEDRVARFAGFVSMAISTAESRARVERLAAEQSALRRVALLVADGASPEKLLSAVTDELSRLLGVQTIRTLRFEPDGTATVLASQGWTKQLIPVGTNFTLPIQGVAAGIRRTGVAAWDDNFVPLGNPIGDLLRREGLRVAAGGPIIVDGRIWGAMLASASNVDELPPNSAQRVGEFAELVSTAIWSIEARAKAERLAAEQSALRRVAILVSQQASPEQVVGVVTEELSRVLDVEMVRTVRLNPDGTVEILAALDENAEESVSAGLNVPVPEGSVLSEVLRTSRPVRREYPADTPTPAGGMPAARSVAGGPVIVDGQLWGAIVVGSTVPYGLRLASENRVAEFAQLLSTSISNIESRANVERRVAEQSALRRVATMVAREQPPEKLFPAIAHELGVLLDVEASVILEYDREGKPNAVADWDAGPAHPRLGRQLWPKLERLAEAVYRTGSRQRSDNGRGPRAGTSTDREPDFRSIVLGPVVVAGTTWGAIGVTSRKGEPLPERTEEWLTEFGRHAGTAVANAKRRADLEKSRARVVRAGDEALRRVERGLHDSIQQQLVVLLLDLHTVEPTVPPQLRELRQALSRLERGVTAFLENLREVSSGIHPALLSAGGLSVALRSLARRSTVPVNLRLDMGDERFGQAIELAAYYVASEALANCAKHANASHIELCATRRGDWLDLTVSDDGKGGADASSGSGLTGLVDRVEAVGGLIDVRSPHNAGTTIHARLPTTPETTG